LAEGWRSLHNEEIHEFYSSLIVIRAIISKDDEMSWTRNTNGSDQEFEKNLGQET
jgi:hypothetical protein